MNILHLMKDYRPTIGGSVVRNGNMIDAYKSEYPLDQIFIINLEGKEYVKKSDEKGVVVFRVSRVQEMINLAAKLINEEKIDIIQAHNFRFLYAAYISRLKSKRKVRLFVEIHAMYNMAWYKKKMSLFLLKKVDMITVLAECAKKYLVSKCNINEQKVYVVRNGIGEKVEKKVLGDRQFRKELLHLKEEYQIVLYTGSFYEWQGVNFLANFFDEILDNVPQIALVMVGDGPDFAYVKNKYEVAKNKARIKLHVGVSKSEVLDLYEISDVVIIPRLKNLSTNTAVPLKVIEPMELKKVILSADDDGLREILNDNNAMLFDSGNIESLVLALKKIVWDDEKEKRAKQAKIDVSEMFCTWKENARVMHKLYGGK